MRQRASVYYTEHMHTRFMTWAQCLYVAGLALGLLFIIPSAWFPLQLGKLTLVLLCLFVSSILFAFSGGARIYLQKRNAVLLSIVALIPLSYLLSYYFSIDRFIGMTGFSIESDTVLFSFIGFLVFALGLGLFREIWSARVLMLGVALSALLAGLFQYIVVMFNSTLPSIFSDHSVNLVGKWNDLGLVVGLVLVLLIYALEFAGLSQRRRVIASVVALVALLLTGIIHFPLVWSLLLGFSLAFSVWSFISRRSKGARDYRTLVPWLPVCAALISGILLLWGSTVNTNLTTIFPVSSLEVRPSLSSTLGIVKAAHGSSVERFLVGSGPQTFGDTWLLYKPTSVNSSVFWNLDFNVGFSSFVTSLGTIGLLGALAWLLPLLLVVIALIAVLRTAHLSVRERFFALALGISSLYVWCAMFFYVPSEMLILVAFALTGGLLGLVFGHGEPVEHAARRMHPGTLVAALVLVVLVGWSTCVVTGRFIAESYTDQGLLALQQNNISDALSFAARAQAIEKNGDNLRLGADAGFAKLQQLAQNAQNPTQQQIDDFAAQEKQAVSQGQAAITKNPNDYRAYLSLGRVYDLLATLKITNGYENAKMVYQTAATLNPTNPLIPLQLARLEAVHGNLQGVETNLTQSLTLKPDYTDAILFVVQLDVAQKDIPSAIKAAQAAVQSAPGVPSIWFELGLLYYSANDTTDATPILEQAVKLQPDYANAKYFLGLSYAAQGRTQDAVQQFSDLATSNPGNAEVKLILSNLQAGKPPFTGAQPPVTSTPQNRTTAPISQ